MSTTCEPEILGEEKVIFNNQTNEEILIFSVIENNSEIAKENLKSLYRFDNTKMLSANSATELDCSFWYKYSERKPITDMLLVMIIRRSTLDSHPLGYLLENNIYDNKFLLSFDELKSMDFQIIYKD